MTLPSACCKLTPVQSDYTPKGDTFKIGDVTVYETWDKSPRRLLVCAYDIFGYHVVTKQVADKLAECGFRVVMPDFFRGQQFDEALLKDRPALLAWIGQHGSWEKTVKQDLISVLKHYSETEHIKGAGIYGFCWGARMSLDALEVPEIQAAGLIHPSLVQTEDANGVKKPTILLPTKDDADMTDFYEILKKNVGQENCFHHRFEDMHHGFCAARGDLSNELNSKRVNEALEMLCKFFDQHIK